MTVITRRLPYTNIARLKAINMLKSAYDAAPSGSVTLSADLIADMPGVKTGYNNLYYTIDAKEALVGNAVETRTGASLKLKTLDNHFLQVMRLAVDRSVLFADGDWQASDIDFYNLDETGGNLPDINTDEDALVWATHIINGETNRKTAKPTAPDMANPAVSEVSALVAPLQTANAAVSTATIILGQARADLNAYNPTADAFILGAWNFLEASASGLEDSAKRNLLRQFGVVYISTGMPNIIKGHLSTGTIPHLQGGVATVMQTGATAISNSDGLFEINSTAVGDLDIQIEFPGLTTQIVHVHVPDDATDQVFDLGTIAMGA